MGNKQSGTSLGRSHTNAQVAATQGTQAITVKLSNRALLPLTLIEEDFSKIGKCSVTGCLAGLSSQASGALQMDEYLTGYAVYICNSSGNYGGGIATMDNHATVLAIYSHQSRWSKRVVSFGAACGVFDVADARHMAQKAASKEDGNNGVCSWRVAISESTCSIVLEVHENDVTQRHKRLDFLDNLDPKLKQPRSSPVQVSSQAGPHISSSVEAATSRSMPRIVEPDHVEGQIGTVRVHSSNICTETGHEVGYCDPDNDVTSSGVAHASNSLQQGDATQIWGHAHAIALESVEDETMCESLASFLESSAPHAQRESVTACTSASGSREVVNIAQQNSPVGCKTATPPTSQTCIPSAGSDGSSKKSITRSGALALEALRAQKAVQDAKDAAVREKEELERSAQAALEQDRLLRFSQDQEFQQSLLTDEIKSLVNRRDILQLEFDNSTREIREATSAQENATGRLERYSSEDSGTANPRLLELLQRAEATLRSAQDRNHTVSEELEEIGYQIAEKSGLLEACLM